MGKKQNPFNTHSIEQAAEDYIREIDFRMQQRGITSAEAIAEIQAEEQMKEEAAIYVRLVFQLPLTVLSFIKRGKVYWILSLKPCKVHLLNLFLCRKCLI